MKKSIKTALTTKTFAAVILSSLFLPIQARTAGFDTEALYKAALSTDSELSRNIPMPVAYDAKAPTAEKAVQDDQQLINDLREVIVMTILKNAKKPRPGEEEKIVSALSRAQASGLLEPTLLAVINDARVQPLLPKKVLENKEYIVKAYSARVGAELETMGLIPGVQGAESWKDMAARHIKMVKKKSAYYWHPAYAGGPSLFTKADFVAEFENLTGARFTGGNAVEFLVDGPAAFAAREKLIKGAKKSIHMLTWAMYDDTTGAWATELLIAKKKAGVDIKIVVDGNVADSLGAFKTLPALEAAGIQVIRLKDKARPNDGQHCKLMIVDGKDAIAGGMNFGDVYSHMGTGVKWRDTDVQFSGPAIAQAKATFADFWNEGVKKMGLPYGLVSAGDGSSEAATGSSRISVVYQKPAGEARVYLGMLKAIYAASTRINIENAYLIMMPDLEVALMDALQRGVEVNILTNSKESIDTPSISGPILASLPPLLNFGANVYLKQGAKETLHSKFMTVDGVFCTVSSFNFHPRSVRYEPEMTVNILDSGKTRELEQVFNRDISQAKRITDSSQLKLPHSALTDLVRKYFFNQL